MYRLFVKLLLVLVLVQLGDFGVPRNHETKTSPSCNCLFKRFCHKHGMGYFPYTQSKWHIALILFIAIIFFLMLLGLIKGLIGLLCLQNIGTFGLNLLIDLPKPLSHYQEAEIRDVAVVYDEAGWPVHPFTLKRTVRILPTQTEFCLNVVFFLAFPLCLCVLFCEFCCCIKSYDGKKSNICFKTVNIIKRGEKRKTLVGEATTGTMMAPYRDSDTEETDTNYVKKEMRRSRENLKTYSKQ